MQLLSLTAERFRNLGRVHLEPPSRVTVVVGPNGQGKTNLLEAAYFALTLRPLRATRLAELLQWKSDGCRARALVSSGGARREVAVELLREGRTVSRRTTLDGKPVSRAAEFFSGLAVVAFTPDDLEVVKGAPEGRRSLLDRTVFNRYPAFLDESRAYARALKGRNRLLRERAAPDYLAAYDEALAQWGARVWTRRHAVLTELRPQVHRVFEDVGRTARPFQVGYHFHRVEVPAELPEESALAATLRSALSERLPHDQEHGFTSVGPHADDLKLELDGHSARLYASQGQQRALVLAWKLAEVANLTQVLGEAPLLLLDDVSSELDPERNAYLMDSVARSNSQVVLTTTDEALVRRAAPADAGWFRMENGTLRTPVADAADA